MLQDQLQFMEMDVGSMGETQMVVLVEASGNSILNFRKMFPNKNINLGEVLGQCCGKPFTGDCGGYSGGKSAVEHYQDGLFGEPQVTTWTRK